MKKTTDKAKQIVEELRTSLLGKLNSKQVSQLDELISILYSPEPSLEDGVCKYMDCSTRHITLEDNTFLTGQNRASVTSEEQILIVDPHPYGWWIHVFDEREREEEEEELSEPLKALLAKARKLDCVWINLDNSGFEHDDLPSYEW